MTTRVRLANRNGTRPALEHAVLRVLDGSPGPIGSSYIQERLYDLGFRLSEPTVGRLLRKFDQQGFTERVSNRGRTLTRAGKRRLATLDERLQRSDQEAALLESLQPSTVDDLVDLLIARRAIERELARQAALKATDEDIEEFEKFLAAQSPDNVRPGSHAMIVRMGRNRILGSVLALITDNSRLSATLRAILRHENALFDTMFNQDIVDALRRHDAEAAEQSMVAHVDRMLEAVQRFVDNEHESRRPLSGR